MSNFTPSDRADSQAVDALSRRIRWSRTLYVGLAGVFAVGVLVQVYFAGMAVFIDSANWELHTTFVHLIELIPVLLVVLSFLGQFPRRLMYLSGLLVVLLAVQYLTVGMPGTMVAAIHPVNALIIFWVSVVVTRESWSLRNTLSDLDVVEEAAPSA